MQQIARSLLQKFSQKPEENNWKEKEKEKEKVFHLPQYCA